MHCLTPSALLFNDFSESDKEKWLKTLRSQPAAGWDDTITYCGWKDVPGVYVVCDQDAVSVSHVFPLVSFFSFSLPL